MLCFVIALVAMYLSVSSPSSLSVEPGTDAIPETDTAAVIAYTPDDQPFAAEQQGKQTPLSIPISPISLPLILALDFATVLVSSYSDA